MFITPIIPSDLNGNPDKALLLKAEKLLELSSGLYGSQNKQVIGELKNLLRKVNSYYSNRIEGTGTHIINIEKAMRMEYSPDTKERNLQLLSLAHIETQKEIEDMIDKGGLHSPYQSDFIRSIHESFYSKEGMENFLEVKGDGISAVMIPGEFRNLDVKVGHHVALDTSDVESAMSEYQTLYSKSLDETKTTQLLYALASHHRLAWIHPFLDGNGRVSRLSLDAAMYHIDLPGYGLWNISRGLAKDPQGYIKALAFGDMQRQGTLDGKGVLSSRGLGYFIDYMLETATEQVDYMHRYLRISELSSRIEKFVRNAKEGFIDISPVPKESDKLFNYLLLHGEIPRGKAGDALGLKERSARSVVSELTKRGFVTSDTEKSPIRIRFDSTLATYLFPELVPEFTNDSSTQRELL
jgi:Fic family protein